MAYYCGECEVWRASNDTDRYGRRWCYYSKKYESSDQQTFGCRGFSSKEYHWYIVSAICKKLGLSDDYECVSLLHNFRINVLEKDARYDEILREYDIVGPFLAQMIETDDESKELCERLLQVYLVKVLDLIKENKNDEALNRYIEMVNLLRTIYGVNEIKMQNNSPIVKVM